LSFSGCCCGASNLPARAGSGLQSCLYQCFWIPRANFTNCRWGSAVGSERFAFFHSRANAGMAGKVSSSLSIPPRAQVVYCHWGDARSLLDASKSDRSPGTVRDDRNGLRNSFWIQRLLGIPIFCLGIAVLVFSALVVRNSSRRSYQRIPVFLTRAIQWKCVVARRLGFSGTSESSMAHFAHPRPRRRILSSQRVRF